jgi:hypothetical protein
MISSTASFIQALRGSGSLDGETSPAAAAEIARLMKRREQYGHSIFPEGPRFRKTLGWPSGPSPPLQAATISSM